MASGTTAIRPLQRTRLVDRVTERPRDMIVNGELEPGRPLLQVRLPERLGVSRTPLREAFRNLQRDGLVRVMNGNQTVEVVEMTPTELVEMAVSEDSGEPPGRVLPGPVPGRRERAVRCVPEQRRKP